MPLREEVKLQPERLPEINLLPKYERQSASQLYWFIALIIVILLSYIAIGYFYFAGKNELETLQSEYDTLSEKAQNLQAQKNQLSDAEKSSLAQSVEFAEYLAIPTSVLILELDSYLDERSYLAHYEYNYEAVSITTHFETLDKVAQYTSNLNGSKLIAKTNLNNVTMFDLKEDGENNSVNFEEMKRYEALYTLKIDKDKVKKGADEDE